MGLVYAVRAGLCACVPRACPVPKALIHTNPSLPLPAAIFLSSLLGDPCGSVFLIFAFLLHLFTPCVCAHAHTREMHATTLVAIRAQLVRISSLLPSCGFWGLNLCCWALAASAFAHPATSPALYLLCVCVCIYVYFITAT